MGGLAIGLVAIGGVALSLWAVSFRVLSLLAGLGTAVVTVAVVTTLVGWLRDAPRHNVPLEPPADHTE